MSTPSPGPSVSGAFLISAAWAAEPTATRVTEVTVTSKAAGMPMCPNSKVCRARVDMVSG